MKDLKISSMVENKALFWKIDTEGVKDRILNCNTVATILGENTGVLLVCREDQQKFKQFDHWNRKGLACYSVIVPYEKAVSDETSKEELTKICADLVVECLLFWAEKKQKRAAKTRAKAA
jgi:hypothetical protein